MSEVIQRTVQEVEEIAAHEGLTVIYPKSSELFVDLDSMTQAQHTSRYEHVITALGNNGILVIDRLCIPSKSKGHYHLYLKLDLDLSIEHRLVLQAALGSDPVKEALSLLRLHFGTEPDAVSVFFEDGHGERAVKKWRHGHRNA